MERGVSTEQMKDDLGIPTNENMLSGHRASIYGGKKAEYYFELCMSKVKTTLESNKTMICDVVCVEFNYCEKRNSKEFQNEEYQLALGIAEALLVIASQIPFPIVATTAYLLKSKVFDKWCSCET